MKMVFLLCDLIGAAVVVWLLNLVALIPFRRSINSHWTERARILYPARLSAYMSLWVVPANLVLAQYWLWPELTPHWVLVALTGWLGTVAGTYWFDLETVPALQPRTWLHSVLATWLMQFATWFAFLGTVAAMPKEMDWRGWLLACLFVTAFLTWCWGGWLWASGRLGLLAPAPERLSTLANEISTQIAVPVRRVWLLRIPGSLAFAVPYTGDLLFTEQLLARHPDSEISAICAHEIAHLGEPKLLVAARVVANLSWMLPLVFLRPLVHEAGPHLLVPLGVVTLLIRMANQRFIRYLEKRADLVARKCELESGSYARALTRLHADNLVPAVLSARTRSHPDLYDRLLALGIQPDFARPEPPAPNTVHGMFFLFLLISLVFLTLARHFP